MRKRWIVVTVVCVILVGLFVYGLAETFRIEVKQYTYHSPDVPEAFDGTRIVMLADIHRGAFFSEERVGRLVDRVNRLAPDIVLLGGDYVYGSADYQASCFAELARLEAPLGRFAVLGNHDYEEPTGSENAHGKDPSAAVEATESAGIELLDNRGTWVEKGADRIRIGGVSDYQEDIPLLGPAVAGTIGSDFVLLLSHNPDYAEELPPDRVDLVLSGHTHGGQVTFFGLYAPRIPSEYGQKYRTGVVQNGSTTVIVSNGIGTAFPPVRLFARPQIVVVTLKYVAAAVDPTVTEG